MRNNRDLTRCIASKVNLSKTGVWVLSGAAEFIYRDGSEEYLHKVLSKASDLSSLSRDLESWIVDWPSEYHLSRRRSLLLRGLDFDQSMHVLEVGCGCGAITRFLGETFASVVAVEGSLSRAELARLRTRDMDNVEVVCASFQDIQFTQKFDCIFCIGVLEYAGQYFKDPSPYEVMIDAMKGLLKPGGQLVMAIENQFGLKYFSSSTEDHTGIMFEGIEGYHSLMNGVRTFGYSELSDLLKKAFPCVSFNFPYPDYKMPSCVLSQEFLDKVEPAELIGNYISRDYTAQTPKLFNERLALLEIARNHQLSFFSNSFLVVAGPDDAELVHLKWPAVLFNTNRAPEYECLTVFEFRGNEGPWAKKIPFREGFSDTRKMLNVEAGASRWQEGLTLQGELLCRAHMRNHSLAEIFSPCRLWLEDIRGLATGSEEQLVVPGKYVDRIWKNCFVRSSGCVYIDQEWEVGNPVPLKVLIIRSIYAFILDCATMSGINPILGIHSGKKLIRMIGESIGVEISVGDMKEFILFESEFLALCLGTSKHIEKKKLNAVVWNRPWRFLETHLRRRFRRLKKLRLYWKR